MRSQPNRAGRAVLSGTPRSQRDRLRCGAACSEVPHVPGKALDALHTSYDVFGVNNGRCVRYTARTVPYRCGIMLYDVCTQFGELIAVFYGLGANTICTSSLLST